jgi:hypothetical protein
MTTKVAMNLDQHSVHNSNQKFSTGGRGQSDLVRPCTPAAASHADVGAGQQDCTASLSVIAAAVREATAALDAAVTATCSSIATPRSLALLAGEQKHQSKALQQAEYSHQSDNSVSVKAARSVPSTLHSSMIGASNPWHHQSWQPMQQQQQHQQQCNMTPVSTLVSRPQLLARFSSFPGSREPPSIGGRQAEHTNSNACALRSTTSSAYINSLLQRQRACNGLGMNAAVATAYVRCSNGIMAIARQEHQGVQRSPSKRATGRLDAVIEDRQAVIGSAAGHLSASTSNSSAAADGLAGAMVLCSSMRPAAQRPLLRHCSTGGLLGRLKLTEAASLAATSGVAQT